MARIERQHHILKAAAATSTRSPVRFQEKGEIEGSIIPGLPALKPAFSICEGREPHRREYNTEPSLSFRLRVAPTTLRWFQRSS